MATGDPFFTCDNESLSVEQAFRQMVYNDGSGNPVLNINPEGSSLDPFFTCDNQHLSFDQLMRLLIVQDDDGNPVINIATS